MMSLLVGLWDVLFTEIEHFSGLNIELTESIRTFEADDMDVGGAVFMVAGYFGGDIEPRSLTVGTVEEHRVEVEGS